MAVVELGAATAAAGADAVVAAAVDVVEEAEELTSVVSAKVNYF